MRLLEARALVVLIVGPALSGCSGVVDSRPAQTSGSTQQTDGAGPAPSELVPVDPAQLVVTSGAIERRSSSEFEVRSPGMRAQVAGGHQSTIELSFRYLGPSSETVPLGSGELRRQLGVKLRAQDTCNTVYVMWHVEPVSKIEVSVKSNPGQHKHAECGDRGYQFPSPSWSATPPDLRRGSALHTLRATLTGRTLSVLVDGRVSWVGTLPPTALVLDGPVGVRSDNGVFGIELRTSARSAT